MNSSVLDAEHDPGTDSDQNEVNALFAKDVFGFGLNYYQGDYVAIGGATPQANVLNSSHLSTVSSDLYNGNIRYMQTAITHPESRDAMPMLNAYMYDQLNRLISSRSYETDLASNSWNPTDYDEKYYNTFVYDAMGNILGQKRHKRDGTQIESLEYHYHKVDGKLLRNRLYHVNDYIDSLVDDTDIDDMGAFISHVDSIHLYNNYVYDAEGRLVKDRQEEIEQIIWRVDGKVKEIRRPLTSEKKNLIFEYNSFGQRIAKHVHNAQTDVLEKSTYYILDAQGNSIGTYDHIVGFDNVSYYLKERNIYGSSRLGMRHDTLNMMNPAPEPSYGITGNRNYELNNHLGNVLTVINDQVYPISSDNTSIDGYTVGIDNVYDYSPFGVQLDGRTIEKQYEAITDTVFILDEDIVYTSDFVVNQSIIPEFNGWWGNVTTTSLHVVTQGAGKRLRAISTNINHGMNRYFNVTANQAYQIKFDLDRGALANVRFTVYNVDNLGNETVLLPVQTMSTNQLYSFMVTPTQGKILVKIHQNGTFYMDNFVFEQANQVVLHQTGFESAVMVEPTIHGWTFDKGTTLGWHTTGQLNGRYGALQRHVSGLANGLYSVDLYVNIGSNASANIKIYGKDIAGNLTELITPQSVTVSGNQSVFFIQPTTPYPTIIISVEPVGSSPYWIDNYVLKKIVLGFPNSSSTTIESNNFNLFPFLFSPSIDGWVFNTQTERASVVTVSSSKRLNFNRVEQTFATTNGNTCVFSLSKLKVGSGTNPSGDIRVRIIDVATNQVIINTATTAANPTYTFTAIGSQTKIEIQNINIAANTMIYIDNLNLSTTNYTPVYSSNFESTVITQPGLDGWKCDLSTNAYLTADAPSGQEERLIVRGNDINNGAYRDFNVIPGYAYTLNYKLALQTGGTMVVKTLEGVNQIASGIKTSAGTYTLNFTPTTSMVRVYFSSNVQIMLNDIQLEYTHTDTIVTVTPPRTAYRYGFQAQEKDDEISGSGNSYDFGARMHNPRIGRFFALDPRMKEFPFMSPYVFAGNNPIRFIDENGEGPGDRVKKAKELQQKYKEKGVVYSQTERQIGTDVFYSDCSAFVTTVLRESGHGNLFTSTNTGAGTGGGMQGEIQKMSGASTLKEPYSMTPKEGDIMMWGGHVTIVTQVTDKQVKFASMGGSGANIGTVNLTNGSVDLSEPKTLKQTKTWGTGGFWGFWTPVDESTSMEAQGNGVIVTYHRISGQITVSEEFGNQEGILQNEKLLNLLEQELNELEDFQKANGVTHEEINRTLEESKQFRESIGHGDDK